MIARLILTIILAVVALAASSANATLVDNGGGLIYDTDLNITWLDNTRSYATWSTCNSWAEGLSMTVNGVTYADWRLPSTVDGLSVFGYDGTTTAGYNITTSELGHLFYTEFGNKGYYALDGTNPQPGWGLANKGPFTTNLLNRPYWSDTENMGTSYAWRFQFANGNQDTDYMYGAQGYFYGDAMAVHEGNVGGTSTIPEPLTMVAIGMGLAGLGGYIRRRMAK